MEVAPFGSCISCLKGDTTTGVAFEGDAGWITAGLSMFGRISDEQATATFELFAQDELGCEPGTKPKGRVTYVMRLCRECAEKSDAMVGEISREILIYHERMENGWRDAWMDPLLELIIGCFLLVLSGIYWWTSATKGWHDWLALATVVLGPWFVSRAWKRHTDPAGSVEVGRFSNDETRPN